MVSAVNKRFPPLFSLVDSTANQQLHRSTPTQTLTTLLLRQQRLRPLPPKAAILLVVVLGLVVLLAALAIVAPHSAEVPDDPHLLDAHRMHLLFVSHRFL
jgi:hypothetical protein